MRFGPLQLPAFGYNHAHGLFSSEDPGYFTEAESRVGRPPLAADAENLPIQGTPRIALKEMTDAQYAAYFPIGTGEQAPIVGDPSSTWIRVPTRNAFGVRGTPIKMPRHISSYAGYHFDNGSGPVHVDALENIAAHVDFLDDHGIYVYGWGFARLHNEQMFADGRRADFMPYAYHPERYVGGQALEFHILPRIAGVDPSLLPDQAQFVMQGLLAYQQRFERFGLVFYRPDDAVDPLPGLNVLAVIPTGSTADPDVPPSESLWRSIAEDFFA